MLLVLFLITFGHTEISNLSIDYSRYMKGSRSLEVPNEELLEEISVNLKITELRFLYWDNKIHAITTPYKFAWVGWRFELGAELFDKRLQIFFLHHSQHSLDSQHIFVGGRFPVQDSFGLRWRLK